MQWLERNCVVGLLFAVAAPAPAVVIKTSDGNGADTELREGAGITRGGAKDLNTRWPYPSALNMELIGLRFDLTGIDTALITNARLEATVNRTGMPANYGFIILGLNADVPGQDWIEGVSNGLWNAANPFPGLTYDGDLSTSPINDYSQTPTLGQVYWNTAPAQGAVVTFDSNELSVFLREAGNSATLFLQSWPGINTQLRFASKETVTLGQTGTGEPFGTGQYAPRLVFDIGQATNVFQWEYVDPNDPSQGKQQSITLCPEGHFLEQPVLTAPSRNLTKAYLSAADLHRANLQSANLTEAYLHAADLREANLEFANFTDADLSQSNLTTANIRFATFTRADLSGADFSLFTNLEGANFTDANLSQANLSSAYSYYTTTFTRANLSGANLTGATLYNSDFTGANLSGADLSAGILGNFTEANLSGADLTGAFGGNFDGSNLTLAQLYSTGTYQFGNLDRLGLANLDLTGANFFNKSLSSVNFTGTNLSGANFNGANVDYTNFANSTITPAQIYSTANYQNGYLYYVSLANVDLTGANFANKSLTGVNFSGANLSGAVFTGANVQYVNFSGTGLTLAQLYSTASYQNGSLSEIGLANTDLTGVDFSNKYLPAANFSSANLSQANLTNADLFLANFSGANLSGANLNGASAVQANFNGASLTPAQLYSTATYQNGSLSGIGLANTELIGVDLAAKNLDYANFSSANLTGANLTNAQLNYATLTGANLSGAEVRGARFEYSDLTPEQLYATASYLAHDLSGIVLNGDNFAGANFAGQNLTNANFSSANLTDADFTGADVRGASLGGITLAQLYSTASYQDHDLTGISLDYNNLTGSNFAGQNLTNANFAATNLTGANFGGANLTHVWFSYSQLASADFNGAEVRGAIFSYSGISLTQLYSTASYQAHDLTGIQLASHNLSRANLTGQNLSSANFYLATLTRANLSQANLTSADLSYANLTGANLSEANLTDANVIYAKLSSTHISPAQLYSTASYKGHDLRGVHFIGNDLSGANFAGQALAGADFYAAKLVGADFSNANLTMAELINADLSGANLEGANFTDGSLALANLSHANLANANLSGTNLIGANLIGADIRGASLSKIIVFSYPGGISSGKYGCGFVYNPGTQTYVAGTGVLLAQLASTASYAARDLSDITFLNNNFDGGNFAGFNLTKANFAGTTLVGADLSGADARGASGLEGVAAPNFIRPDGHITGLNLSAGQSLSILDYDGPPYSGIIPIWVDQQLAVTPGGMLRMVFETDAWDSTISFAAGIPVMLGGSLELAFAADVNLQSQIGRTFDLFDWTGVAPTGTFAVVSPHVWDLSHLYTTGEVTLVATPEPTGLFPIILGLAAVSMTRRIRTFCRLAMPLGSIVRHILLFTLVFVAYDPSLASPPAIQLTEIGTPIWKPVDFQLFSAPATPFDQEFGQVYGTLLPYDTPLATTYVPHAPPYDTELSAGALAGGYVSQSVFTPDEITLNPNGVYFAFMLVPDPGITGDSRDFESGPVIPNSLFPILNNVDVWLDGVLVDRAPFADAVIPVQERDLDKDGTSHLEVLQAIWHPWDDDLTVGPLGSYDLRVSIRDSSGSGWDAVATFRVALPGDYDYSGTVGQEDYDLWLANFGSATNLAADGNGDGIVNAADFSVWRDNLGATWGTNSQLAPDHSAVPEPSVLVMISALGVWGIMMIRRRNASRRGTSLSA